MKTKHIKFKNFYKRQKDYLNMVNKDQNFAIIKDTIKKDKDYMRFVVKILQKISDHGINKRDFSSFCISLFNTEIKRRNRHKKFDNQDRDNVINTVSIFYNRNDWESFKGHFVEFLFNLVLKSNSFKCFIEPTVAYKGNDVISHDKNFKLNQFDFIGDFKKEKFVIGEVKYKLKTYVRFDKNNYKLKKSARKQVCKMNYIYDVLKRSIKKDNSHPKVIKYYICINKYNFVIPELNTYKVRNLSEVLDDGYFLI